MSSSPFTNCLFQEDWWLDAVSPNNWHKIIIGDPKNPDLVFPYIYTQNYGFSRIHMPQLTQTLGPWIRDTSSKQCKKLSREKELFFELIEKLPAFHDFRQSFHYSLTNWLPFYWKEFCQTTKYTYVLEDLTDLDKIWKGFQENIRREIRKSQKIVTVKTDLDVNTFISIQKKTFSRQNLPLPFSKEFLIKINNICATKDCRKIFYAIDEQNKIHAAIYILYGTIGLLTT